MSYLLILSGIYLCILSINESRKYNTLITPVSVYLIWNYLLMYVMPIWVLSYIDIYNNDVQSKVILITLINIVGFIIGYKLMPFYKLILIIISAICIKKQFIVEKAQKIKKRLNIIIIILIFIAILSYFLLIILGGGGYLWMSDPRSAYISHRSGAGVYWLIFQWSLLLIEILILFHLNIKSKKILIIISFIFGAMNFLSGSKSNIMTALLIPLLYYNFYIKPFNFNQVLIIFIIMISIFSVILAYHSCDFSNILFDFISYFSEYTLTTYRYFDNEFLDLGYGKFHLSSLWYYVPRQFFPDKPYEYGVLEIHKELFPGAAEIGNTPGYLDWLIYYLDFGIVGVFIFSILIGSLKKIIFEEYIKNKFNISLFIIATHYCIYGIFALAPNIIIISIALIFKKLIHNNLNLKKY